MTQQEIFIQVQQMLANLFEINPSEIRPESKLFEDLELDSIDAIDLIVKLQKTIGKKILPEEFKNVRTVQDVVDVICKFVNNSEVYV